MQKEQHKIELSHQLFVGQKDKLRPANMDKLRPANMADNWANSGLVLCFLLDYNVNAHFFRLWKRMIGSLFCLLLL